MNDARPPEGGATATGVSGDSFERPGSFPAPDDRAGQFAVLLIHQLNQLFAEPCCAMCCAPCKVVKDLADHGHLNTHIRHAPPFMYANSEWWVEDGVDLDWLHSRWGCDSQPPCDEAAAGDLS